ncbi:MAG: hypothetical protein IKT82_07200 [Bacteroidaceae bacterium]|nr:hypothetical protein [Bacteroidaceae bacterium]
MNNFEKQISDATKSLRDKQNAFLRTPAPPRVSATKSRRSLIWWTGIAAALCVGYFLGAVIPFRVPDTLAPLAEIRRSEILRDTIFTNIRDTLFLEREVPIYLPAPAEKDLAVVLPQTDSLQTNSSTSSTLEVGKSILDDTIHYALFVSM